MEPASWSYSMGEQARFEELEPGSMGFSLCGVPVVYRMADSAAVKLKLNDGEEVAMDGAGLDTEWSQSLFRREGRIEKIVVDVANRR